MKYLSVVLSVLALLIGGYALFTLQDVQNSMEADIGGRALPIPQVDPENKVTEDLQTEPSFKNAKSWDLPDSLWFAGERVPMERTYVREMFDRELHINTYWHNNTIFLIKRANRWLPQMKPILEKNEVPADFMYLTVIESSLTNAVSPSNAVGFWQFLEGTAKDFGLEVSKDVDERYHPIKSTEAASKYLKKAFDKFGNWTNVAASYNRGMAGLDRALENQEVNSYYDALLNSETSRYVFRILAIKTIFNSPQSYGFDIKPEHLYYPEETKLVKVTSTIPDLKAWAKEQGITYLLLKRHNPWLRTDQLKVRNGKSYEIAIPINP